MPAPPSQPKGPKPPKLKIDKKYGGENPNGKYKDKTDFRKMHRTYWWMKGYDLTVASEDNMTCRLICKQVNCTYNCTAEFTTFPELNGASGFRIIPDSFNPTHNHPPPFVPMNPDVENKRISTLRHNDPSLENPPLVPVQQGLAGSASSVGGGGMGGNGGAGGLGGVGEFAMGGSVASMSVVNSGGVQQQHYQHPSPTATAVQPTPAQTPTPQQQHYSAVGSLLSASGTLPAYSPGVGTPQPLPLVQHQQQQQQPYNPYAAAPQQPVQQMPPPPPSYATPTVVSAFAPPPPNAGLGDPSFASPPLGSFLLQISPSFLPHLPHFTSANGIPLDSTTPFDLMDLDSSSSSFGAPSSPEDDRAIFDVLKDVPSLPPFLIALAADGVRKARVRREDGRRNGTWVEGVSSPDGRMAVGLRKVRAEKWVRVKIRAGQVGGQGQGMGARL
ncbi:hypothetical protein JCM8547_007256 [Rhodosporidiobolus lusitaniae]